MTLQVSRKATKRISVGVVAIQPAFVPPPNRNFEALISFLKPRWGGVGVIGSFGQMTATKAVVGNSPKMVVKSKGGLLPSKCKKRSPEKVVESFWASDNTQPQKNWSNTSW